MSSPENGIKTYLSVEVSGQNHLTANVTIENRSSEPAWIFKYSLCENEESSRNLFSIHDSAGQKVDYIGRYVKVAPKPEHFRELQPGNTVSTSCRLDRLYEFHKGEDTYTIKFNALSTYLAKNQKLELESNTVSVRYTKG